MAVTPQNISSQLHSLFDGLSHYSGVTRLHNEVSNVLGKYPSLKAHSGIFYHGAQQVKLLYIFGTIPITFKGAAYNIPVTIFFDPPYPNAHPRCYVTPTQSMQIKPGHRYVDYKGMIIHPYLTSWNANNSNLLEILGLLTAAFCIDPPVFSKSSKSSISSNNSNQTTSYPQTSVAALVPGASQAYRQRLIGVLSSQLIIMWSPLIEPIIKQIGQQAIIRKELTDSIDTTSTLVSKYENSLGKADKMLAETETTKRFMKDFLSSYEENMCVTKLFEVSDNLSQQILDLTVTIAAYDDFLSLVDSLLLDQRDLAEFIKVIRMVFKDYYISKQLLLKALEELCKRSVPT